MRQRSIFRCPCFVLASIGQGRDGLYVGDCEFYEALNNALAKKMLEAVLGPDFGEYSGVMFLETSKEPA